MLFHPNDKIFDKGYYSCSHCETKKISLLETIQKVKTKKKNRTYKIVKGKKIPLKDTFIQLKEFRLGTKPERKEIQKARKIKHKITKKRIKSKKWSKK